MGVEFPLPKIKELFLHMCRWHTFFGFAELVAVGTRSLSGPSRHWELLQAWRGSQKLLLLHRGQKVIDEAWNRARFGQWGGRWDSPCKSLSSPAPLYTTVARNTVAQNLVQVEVC